MQSGEYSSPDKVIADGIRLLMRHQQLKSEIQAGIDQLDAGQGINGGVVFAELRSRLPTQGK